VTYLKYSVIQAKEISVLVLLLLLFFVVVVIYTSRAFG